MTEINNETSSLCLMNEPLKFSLLVGVILVVIGIAISRLQVESNTGI